MTASDHGVFPDCCFGRVDDVTDIVVETMTASYLSGPASSIAARRSRLRQPPCRARPGFPRRARHWRGSRQHLILLDRNIVGFRDLDDFGTDCAPAFGDHARRAGAIVMQRHRELAFAFAT